jgi:hypothetical protein
MLNPSKVNGVSFSNQNFMEDNIVSMQNTYNLLNSNTSSKQMINPMQASSGEYNPMAQYNPQQGIQLNFTQLNTSSGNARVNTSQNQSLNVSNSKDMSTSKSRSKNNTKNKNYQVQINDDIVLIERIEGVLNQITNNHNRVCPYSSRSKQSLSH